MPFRYLIVTICLFVNVGCSPPSPKIFAIYGNTMGTSYTVKFVHPNNVDFDKTVLKKKIDETLVKVNMLMSTYDPHSEISQFNQSPAKIPFQISEQTELVLNEAIRLAHLTNGILDITAGPYINLWGFGPDKVPNRIPSASELSTIKEYIGIDKLELLSGYLTKSNENVYVDLSSIAKGYGVDVVANIVEESGIKAYLVEIGGEMKVKGEKSRKNGWVTAIEKPITNERAIQRYLTIGDNSVATSGDYRNYFESNGKRYSHLINPKTGAPITHNLVSVTVIHSSSMTADGLATALNVMGPEKAKTLAESEGLSILMITKENGEFVEYMSPMFTKTITVY
jgi:thiamine biosynthesis lipoprotein